MSNQNSTQDNEDTAHLGDDNSISSLPSFAPPEAVKALQEAQEQKAAAQREAGEASLNEDKPALDEAAVEPVAAEAAGDEVKSEQSPEKEPEQQANADAANAVAQDAVPAPQAAAAEAVPAAFTFNPDTVEAALRGVVGKVLAERDSSAGPSIDQEVVAKVAEHLKLSGAVGDPGAVHGIATGAVAQGAGVAAVPMTSGQRAQVSGANALAEGLGMAAGGTMALVGAAARTVGRVGHGIASLATNALDGASKASAPVEPVLASAGGALSPVLPRLSEYRIIQAEKAADTFSQEQEKFWMASPKLSALRDEIDRIARERGVPKQDLMEEMKPGGDLAELRSRFNEAVAENPEALTHKRSMDKALDSYVRQYGRAQEEMLNPEQTGNPHYEGLKARLNANHTKMEESAADVPAFAKADGELEKAHLEKLRAAVAAIMTKIREVVEEFTKLLSGKREVDHAPAP